MVSYKKEHKTFKKMKLRKKSKIYGDEKNNHINKVYVCDQLTCFRRSIGLDSRTI